MRPIFFCHLPKTGGSSLRLAIETSFKPHEIMPDAYMMARFGGHYPHVDLVIENLVRQQDAVRLLRGHYHLSVRKLLPDPITITILREPVSRVVSNLKHNIQHNGVTAEEVIADLERGTTRGVVSNAMTRYLGGDIGQPCSPDILKVHHNLLYGPIVDEGERLRSAVQALETINILGLTEKLEGIFASLTKLGLPVPKQRVNISRPKILKLSNAHMERIRELNSLDVALYEEALKICKA